MLEFNRRDGAVLFYLLNFDYTMTTNAIIYARVSSKGDRQTTERQIYDLNKYAEAHGLKVVAIFEEHISGAKANQERKALQDCFELAESGAASTIICSELSRLGRSVWDLNESVKRAIDNKINIIFLKEGFSLFDSNGEKSIMCPILIATLGTCAEVERQNIYYRLNSGRELAKSKGVKMGRPMGSKNKHTHDEELKIKYSSAITLLRKGYSVRAVAKLEGVSPTTIQKLKSKFT